MWKEKFDQHGSFLQERMDPDSGLLDKLLANKTLSKIEYNKIKGNHQSLFYERNAGLLDYISQKNKYESLIRALRDNCQTHLVNYMIGNGEYKTEYGGDWPLTDNELSILDTNQESLVDLVDCSDLLIRLFSAQVINGRQRETIFSEPTNHRRNEVLLDILRRRSVDDYRQVIRCLHESNQSHVAEILDKGGVVVRVHASLGNDKDADQIEDEIITRFKDILRDKSLDEVNRIMEDIDLTIIAAKKGLSVVLYVYCRTTTELTNLYEVKLSGKLRSTVQQVFKQLLLLASSTAEVTVEKPNNVYELYRSRMKKLTVTLTMAEYEKSRSYFSDECIIIGAVRDFNGQEIGNTEYNDLIKTLRSGKVKGQPHSMMLTFKKGDYMVTTAPENIGDNSVWWKVQHLGDGRIGYIIRNHVVIDYSQETTRRIVRSKTSRATAVSSTTKMSFLPLDVLDIILQKSYLHYAFNSDRIKDQSDRYLVTLLATVDRCWSERLRKRRFKRIIWRHFSISFNKGHQLIAVLRSNHSFLVEIVRLTEGLIDQLRLCDCLTDVQSRLLKRQTVTNGKRKLIGRNNNSDLLHFISSCDDTRRSDCLRCFRQSSQKLVTKVIDNGGVAVKVNLCGRDAKNLQQLSERLNDLHDKAKLRSDTKERAINQLVDSGIEFFLSHMDRQAVLYFWCTLQTGLENLRILCESKSIVDVIGDLTQNTSSQPEAIGSRMIDVDIDQFTKTFVVCPILDRFIATLDMNMDFVRGVTMLRQEICVLCRNDRYSSGYAIRVFQNRNPFSPSAIIDIDKVKEAKDIRSSDEEDCFFVLDSREKCVWKIARHAGDHKKFLDFQSTHFPPPLNFSVYCNGHELLILTPSSLNIYGAFRPEGVAQEPLLAVQLPFDIKDPLHAVEASSGHFIILHSLKQDDDETAESNKKEKKRMFVVSKLTRDGRLVIRRFIPQNETQELKDPWHLALDSDDRVFVADSSNDRVIFLDSDLSWIRILCSTEDEHTGTNAPRRLFYDKVERQLIVAGILKLIGLDGVNIYSIDRK